MCWVASNIITTPPLSFACRSYTKCGSKDDCVLLRDVKPAAQPRAYIVGVRAVLQAHTGLHAVRVRHVLPCFAPFRVLNIFVIYCWLAWLYICLSKFFRVTLPPQSVVSNWLARPFQYVRLGDEKTGPEKEKSPGGPHQHWQEGERNRENRVNRCKSEAGDGRLAASGLLPQSEKLCLCMFYCYIKVPFFVFIYIHSNFYCFTVHY